MCSSLPSWHNLDVMSRSFSHSRIGFLASAYLVEEEYQNEADKSTCSADDCDLPGEPSDRLYFTCTLTVLAAHRNCTIIGSRTGQTWASKCCSDRVIVAASALENLLSRPKNQSDTVSADALLRWCARIPDTSIAYRWVVCITSSLHEQKRSCYQKK